MKIKVYITKVFKKAESAAYAEGFNAAKAQAIKLCLEESDRWGIPAQYRSLPENKLASDLEAAFRCVAAAIGRLRVEREESK